MEILLFFIKNDFYLFTFYIDNQNIIPLFFLFSMLYRSKQSDLQYQGFHFLFFLMNISRILKIFNLIIFLPISYWSFPIPNIQDLLLILDVFRYATSPDLTMACYHITLYPVSPKLCTIVLPWNKFLYQKLSMRLLNSPDIFQDKMNELLNYLVYVRAYIDDLSIISNSNFEHHQNEIKILLSKLPSSCFQHQCRQIIFCQR